MITPPTGWQSTNITFTQCEYCGSFDNVATMLLDNALNERFCSQRCHTICMQERAESQALTAAYTALIERAKMQAVMLGWGLGFDTWDGYYGIDGKGLLLGADLDHCITEEHAWRALCEWAIDQGLLSREN